MQKERPFADSEWDVEQEIYVSSPILEDYSDQLIFQNYVELFQSRTPKEFYERVSELIFHARHLLPHQHAVLSSLLKEPFKPGHRRSRHPERDADIRNAVRKQGGIFPSHPWQGLKGKRLVEVVMKKWGLTEAAAIKAITRARGEVKSGMR